jgi:hypothetical protein
MKHSCIANLLNCVSVKQEIKHVKKHAQSVLNNEQDSYFFCGINHKFTCMYIGTNKIGTWNLKSNETRRN